MVDQSKQVGGQAPLPVFRKNGGGGGSQPVRRARRAQTRMEAPCGADHDSWAQYRIQCSYRRYD